MKFCSATEEEGTWVLRTWGLWAEFPASLSPSRFPSVNTNNAQGDIIYCPNQDTFEDETGL